MEKINYIKGDATKPVGDGVKIIVHVCNNLGGWGAGFVMALSKRWSKPEEYYRLKKTYTLGTFEIVAVEKDIMVCNLIGQEGTVTRPVEGSRIPPIRYVAIETALTSLASLINTSDNKPTVHMPRIGSGLAGGNWNIIEKIIEETLCKAGVSVTVYDFD